jgi:serpin B
MRADKPPAGDPLAALGRDVTDAAWPSPDQLRSTAARRRRRRRLIGGTTVGAAVATAIALVVVVPGETSHAGVHVPAQLHVGSRTGVAVQLVANDHAITAPSNTTAPDAVAQAEQEFTFALLRQRNTSGKDDKNVVLSPSSLAVALSMLQTGALGETRQGIAKTLQTTGLTTAQQNAGWAALTIDLVAAGKKAGLTLESANSLWLQQNLPMQQPFMDAMARYFKSGVWQVDFNGNLPGAVKAINAWVKDKTHEKITKLFADDDIDASTALVLANAVYFKAAWQTQFDPKLTKDGDFHLAGGGTATVPFMATPPVGTEGLLHAMTPGYDAVQLPYTGGRFAALAIMPKAQELTQFVDGLTPDRLRQITSALSDQEPVALRMPRFTAEQYTKLNDTVAAMGMQQAFSAGADFSAMSPAGLMVQNVVQLDYLSVDEKGTEAAAVSGIDMTLSALPSISLDHPFLFLIRDTQTGTIMFAAQIQHPQG